MKKLLAALCTVPIPFMFSADAFAKRKKDATMVSFMESYEHAQKG